MSARAHALSTGPDGFPPSDSPLSLARLVLDPDPEEEALACSGSSTEILLVGGVDNVDNSSPIGASRSVIRRLPPCDHPVTTRTNLAPHGALPRRRKSEKT